MSELAHEFLPVLGELAERQAAVAERLGMLIGVAHLRLAIPANRHTTGDNKAAGLTYGQITTLTMAGPEEIPGMPDAKFCDDPEVLCRLAEGHLMVIDRYLLDGRSEGTIPNALAGFTPHDLAGDPDDPLNPDYLARAHPVVGGYQWYRALGVRTSGGDVAALLLPWMQINNGGSPMPRIYTVGETTDKSRDDVRAIAGAYPISWLSKAGLANY